MKRYAVRATLSALLTLGLCMPVLAATITVTSIDDSVTSMDGKVSLREAITSINAGNSLADPDIINQTSGVYGVDDTIQFNIAGAGVHVITTTATMTPIYKTVFINGYSQPGASPNTNPFSAGINAVVLIEIVGTPGNAVLNIIAAGTEVRGLAIHGGSNLIAASDVVIAGNFLGTDASGTIPLGLIGSGACVRVFSYLTPASNVIIGGPADADRNLIVSSGNGVILPYHSLNPGPGTGYIIQGNYIGTDITGTVALARGDGLNAISNALVVGNLISGNPLGGMVLTDDNVVHGNLIGTALDGVSPLPNGNFGGIWILGGNSTIGGDGPGEANIIANHQSYGIVIYDNYADSSQINTRNRFSHNSIYANGRLGISVDYSPFVLPNDTGDGDSWANDLIGNDGQNYPVLTSALLGSGNVSVSGTLNSIAGSTFTLEFFANAVCDQSGYGQGQTYLGKTDVSTNASGNANFGPLTFAVPSNQFVITSTATDAAGNTSEFSNCSNNDGIFFDGFDP